MLISAHSSGGFLQVFEIVPAQIGNSSVGFSGETQIVSRQLHGFGNSSDISHDLSQRLQIKKPTQVLIYRYIYIY